MLSQLWIPIIKCLCLGDLLKVRCLNNSSKDTVYNHGEIKQAVFHSYQETKLKKICKEVNVTKLTDCWSDSLDGQMYKLETGSYFNSW
jgi:hypothetical protein